MCSRWLLLKNEKLEKLGTHESYHIELSRTGGGEQHGGHSAGAHTPLGHPHLLQPVALALLATGGATWSPVDAHVTRSTPGKSGPTTGQPATVEG